MGPVALARLARAIAPTWIARPRTPLRMVLALTRRCGLRCATCRTYRKAPGAELRPGEVAALMRACPDLAWLDLTGGEIFVRRDLPDVLDAVLANTPRLAVLHFPTSGWFPDRAEAACRRVRAGRPEVELVVTVSFDGGEELHDRLRGRKGSFARAVETWARLRGLPGTRVFAGTTVSRHNEDALDTIERDLAASLPGFDARSWHFNLAIESGLYFGNAGTGIASARPLDVVRRALASRGVPGGAVALMETAFLLNLAGHVRGEGVGFPCQAMRSACFVSADGVLYPCHVWDRPVASLREAGFDMAAAWGSPAALAAREEAVRLACGGCFTPCEAYPAIAGSPMAAAVRALIRSRRVLAGPWR
jgi:MoaA/NifB/PqqE/SkfB family radical SAM enzyme